ncbi:MAG: LacI family transcriptional regulator [Ignavibacteriae bacterium]|nr:MAG: LacI family transcriptional regulator [Ignavibacteriota bacterium]
MHDLLFSGAVPLAESQHDMSKKFHVTLHDIAQQVNVSKVTVSKALRGHPDISAETVKKIKSVASELGYFPNYMARNLSSNRSHTIGVVVPKIAHFFFSAVIEAIYDAALENNYDIILTVSQENVERELRQIRSLLSMRVDGIIISVTQQTKDPAIFYQVKEMGIPVTFMDRAIDGEGFNSVVADDFGGAYTATEYAIKSGFQRIGHLGGFAHTMIGKERFRGFKAAMQHYKMPLHPEWIVRGGFSDADGYDGFMKLYESHKLPDFLFAVTYPVALGVHQAARQVGMNIPKDIDIISFGPHGLNEMFSPQMNYIEQPTIELGKKAVELTLNNIRQRDGFIPQKITLPTKLVLCDQEFKKVAS